MKFLCFASVLIALLSESVTLGSDDKSHSLFRPLKVSYDEIVLKNGDLDTMMDQLTDVGLITITNMPDSFRNAKKNTLAWTHPCSIESSSTKEHTFPDGTRRRTMASHTIPGDGGIQSIDHHHHHGINNNKSSGSTGSSCQKFDQSSIEFRKHVDSITRAFSDRLAVGLTPHQEEQPLLKTEDGYLFKSIQDVVDNGEHLEHFHSYQGSSSATANEEKTTDSSTIEWHTDQGLFLVFTPGMLTESTADTGPSQLLDLTKGFFIELADGSRSQVQLDQQDDLVIMLGDGVNQYVNPSLSGPRKLRAVPHALAMPATNDDKKARVWYGRMVLPPASAIHPQHGKTFGHLRQLLIEASTTTHDDAVLSLGCSGSSTSSFSHARQLEESSCEEGTLLCWHRCMSLEEFGVSADICSEQDMDLWCINPRGQLWDHTHGDYFPGCIDSENAPNATEYDRLPDYPRDEEDCTDEAYESYVASNAEKYDFHADLMEGGTLYWSVVDGDTIDGMFSFNGLFGYTALGFSGFPGGNLMHGAIIIMATPSSEYSAVTGFNYSHPPVVEEYIIDAKDKSFRHWQTPVTALEKRNLPASSYDVEETDCFTSMTFKTAGIYNTTFNVSGSDQLIWGANGWDMFAGYHARSRGVIDVEWATGKVTLDEHREAIKANLTQEAAGDAADEEHDDEEKKDHDQDQDLPEEGEDVSGVSKSFASVGIGLVIMALATTFALV